MFDSLADQIKRDEHEGESPSRRYFVWGGVVVVTVLLFGGLYFAVRLLG